MKKSVVNNELSLSYPNAFRDMEMTELQLAFGTTYTSMWGIRDERHHMIVAVIWKEASKFLQRLVSTQSLVTKFEKDMRKALAPYGYHCDGFFESEVAGQAVQGFRYTFENGGVRQQGEATVLRHGRVSYTLYYYTQEDRAGANRSVYQDMLASAALV